MTMKDDLASIQHRGMAAWSAKPMRPTSLATSLKEKITMPETDHSPLANIGYFDEPGQEFPAHNPCLQAPCPVCGEVNGEAVKYRSVMPMSGKRSYFFAYHKACAGSPKIDAFEEQAMTEIFAWDDAAKENTDG